MLIRELRQSLITALKAKDRRRVETLRFLLAAIQNTAIAKYGAKGEAGLTDADVLEVIKKQVNSHKQSIDAFEKARREDLVRKEKEELAILETYLSS